MANRLKRVFSYQLTPHAAQAMAREPKEARILVQEHKATLAAEQNL